MPTTPLPPHEQARLRALSASGALAERPSRTFKRIAGAAARSAGAPIGLVSFITADRQWIKAAVGTTLADTDRQSAFCAWTIYNAGLLWVEDALADDRFADNPLVLGQPNIRAYAGAPIVSADGYALGAVCAIDRVPRSYDPRTASRLQVLAARASAMLQRDGADQRVAA